MKSLQSIYRVGYGKMTNRLFYGDCLQIMENDIVRESVDLIYLDPPFNSNRNYNAIYKDSTGKSLPEQIEAFCDVWELNEDREKSILDIPMLMRNEGIDESFVELWELWMSALRKTQPRLLAYLSYMTERLLVMKAVLKRTGSIYYHCDPTASHYIKVLMDSIFGYENFRNEIIWLRDAHGKGAKKTSHQFPRSHDVILMYSKGKKITYNNQFIPINDHQKKFFIYSEKETKRKFRASPLGDYSQKSIERLDKEGLIHTTSTGKKYKKYYMDEAKSLVGDIWTDIGGYGVKARSKERLGYPTQKPLTLLKRIISASSKKGDLILDPFCGCATTIAASHELERNWIGIDIAYHAIKRVVQSRLYDHYHLIEDSHYKVDGIPLTKESALNLWERDKYQFQRWAVESVDGFVTTKRSNDGGIDGKLFFKFPDKREISSMILEVKGGENLGIDVMRKLRGVLERSESEMAGLIMRNPLGDQKKRNFQKEITASGFINDYPRMQILTLNEILQGKKFRTPDVEGKGGRQGIFNIKNTLENKPITTYCETK